MSQATQAVHDLKGFLTFFFFVIKRAKMDFIFKLSFLLYRVTNQNLKNPRKTSYHKHGKNRGKKLERLRV